MHIYPSHFLRSRISNRGEGMMMMMMRLYYFVWLVFLSYWISSRTAQHKRNGVVVRGGGKPLGLDCRATRPLFDLINNQIKASTSPFWLLYNRPITFLASYFIQLTRLLTEPLYWYDASYIIVATLLVPCSSLAPEYMYTLTVCANNTTATIPIAICKSTLSNFG